MSVANIYRMITGMRTYLIATLPTYTAAIEADLAGAVRLPLPATVDHIIGYRDIGIAERLPMLCYIAGSGTSEPSGSHAVNLSIIVDLIFGFQDSDPARLENRLLSYTDSFANLIAENEDLGGVVNIGAFVTEIDWYHGSAGTKDKAILALSVRLDSEILTP
jgi:hypothetical protein